MLASKLPCACGTLATYARNGKSKRLRVWPHQTPEGAPCPHYEEQAALERTNKVLAAAGLPTEEIYNAPIKVG
jgi:hypothetical protein